MARVLAISSQVARGAVGLSVVVPALQALGHEVTALPTILLSNHPGHARFAGQRIAPELLAAMLIEIEANGWLAEVDAVLTGYLPSVEHVAVAREAIERARAANPRALVVCDPVLGDEPKGLYIAREAAEVIRARLVPIADVVKMNRFECGWLAGAGVDTADDVAGHAMRLGWPVAIVSSLITPDGAGLANVLVEGGSRVVTHTVARRARAPNGTGDLMGALWLGHRLAGAAAAAAFARAVEGVTHVLDQSEGRDELQLVAGLAGLRR